MNICCQISLVMIIDILEKTDREVCTVGQNDFFLHLIINCLGVTSNMIIIDII